VKHTAALPLDDQQPPREAGNAATADPRQAVRALAVALIAEVEANATTAATSVIAAAAEALRGKLPLDPGSGRTSDGDSPWALGAGIGFALAALLRHPDR
jgi:hypothetical protein